MITIDQVKAFINEYLEWEFQLNRNMYNADVNLDDYVQSGKNFKNKFYTPQLIFRYNNNYQRQSLDDPRIVEARLKRIVKRELFVIRKFKGAKMANTMTLDNNILFSCIVGFDDKTPSTIYSSAMDVASVNGELRIVSIRTEHTEPNASDRLKWTVNNNSPDKEEGYYISDEGELLESFKYTPPGLDQYLIDYNS